MVSKGAVRKGLIDFGIPIREVHKPHGNRSQLPFGMVRRVEKEIEFKKEQRIILAIRGLKEKGLSLRDICSTLSIMGIPTKCNGKKWHPQMVSRILMELDV